MSEFEVLYLQKIRPCLTYAEPPAFVKKRIWYRIEEKIEQKRTFWEFLKSPLILTPTLSISTLIIITGLFFMQYSNYETKQQLNNHLSAILVNPNINDWIYEVADL